MAYQLPGFGRFVLETPVVVAGNQDFISVGQFGEPQVQILQFVQSADSQAVAGVDQQVAVRHLDLAMHAVGVGDADYSHGVEGSDRWHSRIIVETTIAFTARSALMIFQ